VCSQNEKTDIIEEKKKSLENWKDVIDENCMKEISIKNFQKIETIAFGSTATVEKMYHLPTNKIYAVKV